MNGRDWTKAHESCRLVGFLDTLGVPTAGWGRTGAGITEGMVITQAQADAWFEADYTRACVAAGYLIRNAAWSRLDPIRQAILVDMSYQLGEEGLSKFPIFLQAMRDQNWCLAAVSGLTGKTGSLSRWALQTPHRAADNMAVMLLGKWPAI